ncbi:uncharacterized protein LOC132553780 [Ylistrum balloti]|uniref:uncharacterized protein LOC132553780 n=1 Tax=Ylistrum balloti TaxID=509963 RepID=UPI002905E623|nr:uncharacterized protein LOC132553780 [Ylistrum balloti]
MEHQHQGFRNGSKGRDEPKRKHPRLTTLLFGKEEIVNSSNNYSHLSKLLASKPKYVLQTTTEQCSQQATLNHQDSQVVQWSQTNHQESSQSTALLKTNHQQSSQSLAVLQTNHQQSSQSPALLQTNHQQSSQSATQSNRTGQPSSHFSSSFQQSSQSLNTSPVTIKHHNQSLIGFELTERQYGEQSSALRTKNIQNSQSQDALETTDAQSKPLVSTLENGMHTKTDMDTCDMYIKTENEDDYQECYDKPCLSEKQNSVHGDKSSTVSRPQKNSSILSLLKSGPAYRNSFNNIDTISHQNNHVPVILDTVSKQDHTRPVPVELSGYQDNIYHPVTMETRERGHRSRAYTLDTVDSKDDAEYLPSVPHRTRANTSSSVSVLQKSHKRLSDLLSGPSSSSLSSTISSAPVKTNDTQNSSDPNTVALMIKNNKHNSVLLQQLLTIGPSGYVRQSQASDTETKDTKSGNTTNLTEKSTHNNTSSALLKLLHRRKQNEVVEKVDNRSNLKSDFQECLKFSGPHPNTERKTTGKLDATIEKLSSMLVDKVIQGSKLSETELPPHMTPSPSTENRYQELTKEKHQERPSLLKALVKEKIHKEQEKVEREAFLLETLKRSLAEPRDELVAQLPLPGKDFLNFYKCDYCGKAFPHKGTLKVHMRTHSMEKQEFKCDICGKVCSAKGYLLIHMRTHRQEYGNNHCEEALPTQQENPLVSQKSQEDLNRCYVCGKSFSESENLRIHLRMHSGEKLYKCETCGNGFTRKTQLAIHMRIHTGEKPYECEVCGKTFRQSNGLNLHMITHSEIKPYNCKNCGAGFGRKSHYEKHMRWHRGERPFHCSVCGKAFTDKFNLSTHFKIHNQKKDHVCDLCGKGYNQATHLKNHMQFHTGERGYQCSDCDSVFEHKRTLQNHIKCTHFDTYERSLTSKTSLRKFQKLREDGRVGETDQEQSSETSSDFGDSNDNDDNDESVISDGDDMYSGEEKFVIKNEPGDWYPEEMAQSDEKLESSYEGAGQSDEGMGQFADDNESNKNLGNGSRVKPPGNTVNGQWKNLNESDIKKEALDLNMGETGSDFNHLDKGQGHPYHSDLSHPEKGEGHPYQYQRETESDLNDLDVDKGHPYPTNSDNSDTIGNRHEDSNEISGQSSEFKQQIISAHHQASYLDTEVSTTLTGRTFVKTELNGCSERAQDLEKMGDCSNSDEPHSDNDRDSFQRSESVPLNHGNIPSNKAYIQVELNLSDTGTGRNKRREFNGICNNGSSGSEGNDRFYNGEKSSSQNSAISPIKKRRLYPEIMQLLKTGSDVTSKGYNSLNLQ